MARKVTLWYVVAGIVWIIFSNVFLTLFSDTYQNAVLLHLITELVAIAATTVMFYTVLQRSIVTNRSSQQRLYDLEQHYATMMKQASDGIIVVSKQGAIVSANPRAQQLLGHSEEELLAMQATSIIHTNTTSNQFLHFEDILQRKTLIAERWIKRSDATLLPVEISVAPLDNQRIIAIIRDISERKKMEDELRRKEQHYRALIENTFDVIAILNDNGEILYCSPSVEKVFGYQAEELIGHKAFSFLYSASASTFHTRLKSIQQTPNAIHLFETRLRHKDGSWCVAEGSMKNALHNPHISGIIINIRNITHRKLAEDHLILFQTAMEQSSDAMVLLQVAQETDTLPHILYINRACTGITGYTIEHSIGQPLHTVLHNNNDTVIAEALQKSIRDKETLSGESVITHNNGSALPVEWSITPLHTSDHDDTITHATCIFRDITERKQAETDLLAAKERAEEMNKLKTALLSTMNHEFRTPMNGILGFSDILEKEMDNEEHKLFAHMIHNSAERLMKTLTNVIALARIAANSTPVHVVPVDLKAEVEEILHRFRGVAREKGLKLYFDSISSDVTAITDASLLREMITDLLNNAFKFTHKGSVTVQVFTDTYQDTYCAATRIIDTGIGISPGFLPRIFDEFTQESSGVSRSYEGTGLGLTLVRRFLDLVGGDITVESEPGRGSIFTVYLPLQHNTTEAEHNIQPHESLPQNLSVLFFRSPMESSHLLIHYYLSPLMQLTIAHDQEETLHYAHQEHYHLLLIDTIHQHLQDIPTLLHNIRSIPGHKTIPVIALTDYTTDRERQYLVEAGCTMLLSKPFSRHLLLENIARCTALST